MAPKPEAGPDQIRMHGCMSEVFFRRLMSEVDLARFDRSTSTPVRNSQDGHSLLTLGHHRLEHRRSTLYGARVGEGGKDHKTRTKWSGWVDRQNVKRLLSYIREQAFIEGKKL